MILQLSVIPIEFSNSRDSSGWNGVDLSCLLYIGVSPQIAGMEVYWRAIFAEGGTPDGTLGILGEVGSRCVRGFLFL